MVHRDALPQTRRRSQYLARLVADDADPFDTLASKLVRELGDAEHAVDRLAPCHRHRFVVQNLVGDVDPGGDGCADRQHAGVKIGAVTEILKYVWRGW